MVPHWELSLLRLRYPHPVLSQPLLGIFWNPSVWWRGRWCFWQGHREGPQHPATPWTDSTPAAWLPSCCYCCCWSASDILSELNQAWIIGSWNQPKHEPADEGSCFSLNCPLTVKKSICGGALLTTRQEHWPVESLTVLREHQFCLKLVLWGSFCPRLPLRPHKGRLGTCGEDVPSTTS